MPGASVDSHVPTRALFAASVVSAAEADESLLEELLEPPQAVKQKTVISAQRESAIEVMIVFSFLNSPFFDCVLIYNSIISS